MPRLSSKGNNARLLCLSQPTRRAIRLLSLTLLIVFTLGFVSFTVRTRAQSGGAPANDNFANAQAVQGTIDDGGVFSGMTTGTNVGATAENGEPVHACEGCQPRTDPASGASVWYAFTAPFSGRATFNNFDATRPGNSGFDSVMAVYQGSSVDALTVLDSNDDACQGCGVYSEVKFAAVANQTYYIAVDGLSPSNRGSIKLNYNLTPVPPPPANDNFADAQDISGTPSVEGTNDGATLEAGEAKVYSYATGATVWYNWTPPSDGEYVFNTYDSSFDTILGIYTGDSVSARTRIIRNNDDDACECPQSSVRFLATANTTYRIVVDGANGEFGNFNLNWQAYVAPEPPANDDFINALELAPEGGALNGLSNVNATKESGEPDHAGDSGGVSVWFKWTAPESANAVTFDSFGSDIDTTLGVYTANDPAVPTVDMLTESASNDDTDGSQSKVEFGVTPGTTYFIAVDEYSGDNSGSISLNWSPLTVAPPANDNFAAAQVINGTGSGETPITGNNKYATKETGEPDHAKQTGGTSVWYKWEAPASGGVFFKTEGSEFDTLLAVYTGTTVDALTEVASQDNSFTNGGETVGFNVTAGTTYYIAVDGRDNAFGNIVLGYGYDTTAPTTSAFKSPGSEFSNRDTIVFLDAADSESGVRSITYSATGAQEIEQTTVETPFTSFEVIAVGTTTVTFFSTDNAGNVEQPQTVTVKIEKTAPVTTLSASPAPTAAGYNNGNVTLTFNATDADSGVARIVYRTTGAQTTSFTNTFANTATATITAEGVTTVIYRSFDKANNAEAEKTYVVRIDRGVPGATTATPNSMPNSSGYYNGANGGAKVTLSATDAASPVAGASSGISGYYVSASGAQTYTRQFVPASNPTVALADGTTTLTFNAVDNAGNEGAATTATYKVDQTAPVTSYTVSSAGRNITLTVNFRDNLSGYAAVTSSVNGGAPQTYNFTRPTNNGSISYTFDGPYNDRGEYTIKYFGTDVAGNREAEQSVTFRIPPQAITPFASTPVRNANGTYTVTFGYQNDNPTTFNIAVGSSNFFSPNPQNRNQTTAFQPGRVANAFSVTWNGSRLTWTIKSPDGQTRRVSVR